MARGDQLVRQWEILKALQATRSGTTKEALAEQFGVGVRTIDRDFEVFQELGVPMEHELDPDGRRLWKLPRGFLREGSLVLGFQEAVALHLAARLFTPLAGTHYAEALEELLARVRQAIPRQALEHFAEIEGGDTIHVRSSTVTNYEPHRDKLRRIEEALRTQQGLDIRYKALAKQESRTRFDPYGLVYYDQGGDFYVIGRSHVRDDIRVLKVSRIRDIAATSQPFERPSDFDLHRHFATSWGIFRAADEPLEIRVRLTGLAAELALEKEWHPSQRCLTDCSEESLFDTEDSPRAVILTFRLSNVEEFKQWVKSLGQRAEVLKPEWLREQMREELAQALNLYE